MADELPIDMDVEQAERALRSVPLWFHTFALNRHGGLYTPGKARDHGYRLASIPDCFEGLSVLDVGAFDGFYSFLAEGEGRLGCSPSTTSSTSTGYEIAGGRAQWW